MSYISQQTPHTGILNITGSGWGNKQ
jgi:hypothetical protein